MSAVRLSDVRETPLSDIHLENMLALSRMGAVIAPPVPAFYSDPKTIDDIVDHTVGRVLDLFELEMPALRRWNGMRGICKRSETGVRDGIGRTGRS